MSLDFKNREEVPKKYKIDFSGIIENDEKWYESFEYVKNHVNDIKKYKGHLLDNEKILEKWLSINDSIEQLIIKLYIYASVNFDCDINNVNYTKMYNQIADLDSKYTVTCAFIEPELLKSEYEVVLNLINKNKKLEEYRFMFENIYRNKKYTLSDDEEKIISSFHNVFSSFDDIASILNNAEINYGTINIDGEKKEIISSNALEFATHKDRRIRKKAAFQKLSKLEEFNGTFATNLLANLKACDISAKLRGFKNYQEQALYADNVTTKIYDTIIYSVNENIKYNQKWYKVVGKCLGLKQMHGYDIYAPYLKDYDKKYTIEEAQTMIVDALKVLGDEYSTIVTKAYKNGWVDYCSYKGKRSGAYEINAYNTHPLIFTNFKGFISDITNLAHETGHAMHSYFSDKNNDYTNAQPKIFVAEVASLTNEILLSDYIIKNSKDKQEKITSLKNVIETIGGYFFDAAAQAEFELKVNTKVSEGKSLTKEDLNNIYLELQHKYYAPAVKFDDFYKVNWCRIPHFYGPFYTYKYVIGIVGACYVASNVINKTPGFVERYLDFLSSGNTDYPINLLKKLGVDLENSEPYTITIDLFNKLIGEFEELYEEVKNEG